MKIKIVTPAPAGSKVGNRVSADRWARLLRELGHRVEVVAEHSGGAPDLLIALHARKSHASVRRFAREYPDRPLVVVLTGTDLYRDIQTSKRARESLELATRLVTLQSAGRRMLPARSRRKTRVIYQSAVAPSRRPHPRKGEFQVCVVGHLRPVKDPMRAAMAARRLPADSIVTVVHAGAALSGAAERRARDEEKRNPRYRWVGELSRGQTARLMCASRLLVNSSKMEGGANVIMEALACDVPVLCSAIEGSLGILGASYPGAFPVGDTAALAALIARAESDPRFLTRLARTCSRRAHLADPALERSSLRDLLAELTGVGA